MAGPSHTLPRVPPGETPAASSDLVRSRMKRQGRRDTGPEMAVRRAVHARGLRYRIDRSPVRSVRSRADLVFGPTKVAVYVDGCYWHGCSEHATTPKANREWWERKIGANQARDRRATEALEAAGWCVLRFWEHEDPEVVADAIEATVRSRRGADPSAP